MKPNDKAIEALSKIIEDKLLEKGASGLTKFEIDVFVNDVAVDGLTAAYAAQFQSEDYAGLIERLRKGHVRYAAETQDEAAIRRNKERAEAADALEAVLAERDAMKDLYAATDWVDSKLQTFWPADMDDLDEVDVTLTYREIRDLIDARRKARGEG